MTYTQPIPLLDLKAQYAPIREECREAFDRVADAQYFIGGPEVDSLEKEIAAYSAMSVRHRRHLRAPTRCSSR